MKLLIKRNIKPIENHWLKNYTINKGITTKRKRNVNRNEFNMSTKTGKQAEDAFLHLTTFKQLIYNHIYMNQHIPSKKAKEVLKKLSSIKKKCQSSPDMQQVWGKLHAQFEYIAEFQGTSINNDNTNNENTSDKLTTKSTSQMTHIESSTQTIADNELDETFDVNSEKQVDVEISDNETNIIDENVNITKNKQINEKFSGKKTNKTGSQQINKDPLANTISDSIISISSGENDVGISPIKETEYCEDSFKAFLDATVDKQQQTNCQSKKKNVKEVNVCNKRKNMSFITPLKSNESNIGCQSQGYKIVTWNNKIHRSQAYRTIPANNTNITQNSDVIENSQPPTMKNNIRKGIVKRKRNNLKRLTPESIMLMDAVIEDVVKDVNDISKKGIESSNDHGTVNELTNINHSINQMTNVDHVTSVNRATNMYHATNMDRATIVNHKINNVDQATNLYHTSTGRTTNMNHTTKYDLNSPTNSQHTLNMDHETNMDWGTIINHTIKLNQSSTNLKNNEEKNNLNCNTVVEEFNKLNVNSQMEKECLKDLEMENESTQRNVENRFSCYDWLRNINQVRINNDIYGQPLCELEDVDWFNDFD